MILMYRRGSPRSLGEGPHESQLRITTEPSAYRSAHLWGSVTILRHWCPCWRAANNVGKSNEDLANAQARPHGWALRVATATSNPATN